jgi:DNA-binding response OmpR family regulator
MDSNRILLIEDDFDIAEMLLMYFGAHHYQLLHADTGRMGLEMARTHTPSVILLDVMLPDMDGFRVCQEIREGSARRPIPVIFLTHRHERSNKMRGLGLGANDYVVKPFDVDELRLRVQSIIHRSSRECLHDQRTGLPTWTLLLEEIARRQKESIAFTQVRLSLTGFREYSEIYGFMAADDVLAYTARVIEDVIAADGSPHDYVGIDGDQFVLLTRPTVSRRLVNSIIHAFDRGVSAFYSFKDVERGGLMVNTSTDAPEFIPLMQLKVV